MKMRLKMKNRSHKYNINRPRPRYGHTLLALVTAALIGVIFRDMALKGLAL